MTRGKFNFFTEVDIPEDIFKASQQDESKKYDNMIVYGKASTNHEDKQGEILEPAGFDISSFKSEGLINLEHFTTRKGDPTYWIGEPIDARIDGNDFFIKAKLWKDHPKARALWDTIHIMKSSGSTRKLGWSIEGNAIERDKRNKKRILKAKINHVCLTFSPVNANTYADISKGVQGDDYVDYKFETDKTTHGGKEVLIEVEENGKKITIDKDFKITIKSMDLEATAPLRKESLKKKVLDLRNFDVIMKNYKSGKISENVMNEFRNKLKTELILR
jgi:hypothetical protein